MFEDRTEICRLSSAKNHRDPKQSKSGRERAENQILHASFERFHPLPLIACQDIESHGDQFKRHEHHDEIVSRSGEKHSAECEQNQCVELGDSDWKTVRKVHRHDEHEYRGEQKESFEVECQRIDHKASIEGIKGAFRIPGETSNENHAYHRGCNVSEIATTLRRQPKVDHQQRQPACDNRNFNYHQRRVHGVMSKGCEISVCATLWAGVPGITRPAVESSTMRSAAGRIFSVNARGQTPKNRSVINSNANGNFRHQPCASAMRSNSTGNGPCKTSRTARSMYIAAITNPPQTAMLVINGRPL